MTGVDVRTEAKRILRRLNWTIQNPVDRLKRLHEMDLDPQVAAEIGRGIYGAMLENASTLEGDVPGVKGVHVKCDRSALIGLLAALDKVQSPAWRLESVMDSTILTPGTETPIWTIRIVAWGRTVEAARSIADTILMAVILNQPDIDTSQPFDRWDVQI